MTTVPQSPAGADRPTLYTAEWVLPIALPPIRNGGVLVDNGVIAWVGPLEHAPAHVLLALEARGAVGLSSRLVESPLVVEELGAAVLMPGLVNAHSHLELTTLRGFLEGLDFREWLQALTRIRRDLLTCDDLVDAARVGIAEALRHGITTLADTTDSAAPILAMREMGVRGIGYLEVFGPDPARCDEAMERLQARVDELRIHDSTLVRVGISPHAPYTVSARLFAAATRLSRNEQLPIAIHVAESHSEVMFVTTGTGPFADKLRLRGVAVGPQARTPIGLLDMCGVLDVRPLLIHAVHVDETDLARVAAAGATVVHCPTSNAKLGHGIAPLDRMLAHGIVVGLGTDSVASNDRMHLLDEARQATLMHAVRSGRPDSLGAHEALRLATVGGAAALSLADTVGTLETGKAADLTAFPLVDLESGPVYDPAVTLVHALAGRAVASLVTVGGTVVLRDGRVTGGRQRLLDSSLPRLANAAARLKEWRQRGRA